MSRWDQIDAQCRIRGVVMFEKDLSELYTYLELFYKTFTTNEHEVACVLQSIKELFMLESGITDENIVIKALRNPRGAGRKQKYGEQEYSQVQKLHKSGYSVRSISSTLSIPKSTVQRMLKT